MNLGSLATGLQKIHCTISVKITLDCPDQKTDREMDILWASSSKEGPRSHHSFHVWFLFLGTWVLLWQEGLARTWELAPRKHRAHCNLCMMGTSDSWSKSLALWKEILGLLSLKGLSRWSTQVFIVMVTKPPSVELSYEGHPENILNPQWLYETFVLIAHMQNKSQWSLGEAQWLSTCHCGGWQTQGQRNLPWYPIWSIFLLSDIV